jgi:hypothetical protein
MDLNVGMQALVTSITLFMLHLKTTPAEVFVRCGFLILSKDENVCRHEPPKLDRLVQQQARALSLECSEHKNILQYSFSYRY